MYCTENTQLLREQLHSSYYSKLNINVLRFSYFHDRILVVHFALGMHLLIIHLTNYVLGHWKSEVIRDMPHNK